MRRPCSNDLRERVVHAVEIGGLSRRAAAVQFQVAPSTVVNWVGRARRTGSVAPGQMGGRRPRTLGRRNPAPGGKASLSAGLAAAFQSRPNR